MNPRPYRQTESTWSPERRAAQRERMRTLNRDPEHTTKRSIGLALSEKARQQRKRVSKSRKGKPLPIEIRATRAAQLRAVQADPKSRAKISAARRCGPVPEGKGRRYRELRDKIGVEAAMAIVKREAHMARVNA